MTDTIQIDIIVGSEVFNLYGGDFVIQGESGLGLAPSHLITDRSPLQDGDIVRDFRLDPRQVTLGIWGKAYNEAGHFVIRNTLIEAMKLSDTPNKLRYTFSDGTQRQIDFYYNGGMDFPTISRPVWHQKSAVTMYCPDPLFYDPDGKSLTFAQSGGSDLFQIAHAVPHLVGTSGLDIAETKQISYAGSWRSFPSLIRITGPIVDPIVTNETLNLKLDFTGITISAGDYYDIDLRFGFKTVIDSNGNNKVPDLTNDSDLADFHIGAHPKVPGGDNSISVNGTGTTEASKVELSYTEKYVGF